MILFGKMKPFSLYIHIPFCFHKCPYCDFNTYAVSSLPERDYVASLLSELDFRLTLPEWRGRPVQTVYFGGGTPSLFLPSSIEKILRGVWARCERFGDVEISMEANPGTVSTDNLSGFRKSGVNRLSFGAQSFNSETLKALGRMHLAEQTDAAVEASRAVGLKNISIDLLYGAPEQTFEDLEGDISHALSLKPSHISAYALTIEKGTPFYSSFHKGTLSIPPEGVVLRMMKALDRSFKRKNLLRYEISNYALPGNEARHNLAYWNGDDYLGLGAGAHSFVASHCTAHRWSNYALPEVYMEKAVAYGAADSWRDSLSAKELMFEFFFLGLRKTAGVSIRQFEERFSVPITAAYPGVVENLMDLGLLENQEDALRITQKGLYVTDSVLERFAEPKYRTQKKKSSLSIISAREPSVVPSA